MRYELSDCEWSVIKPMLLERERREELVHLLLSRSAERFTSS